MSPPLDADPSLVAALVAAGGHACEIATTLAITTDDALAAAVFASGCAVEHLESYAVAAACARLSIPFVAVLGVANRVGSSAHSEWKRNHEAASQNAASVVRAAFGG
jgi:nucleoside phosphorylase